MTHHRRVTGEAEILIERNIYPLDGNPEVSVFVDAAYDNKRIDATLIIPLPNGAEFLQIQFVFRGEERRSSQFVCTYRDEYGTVVCRMYQLKENLNGNMTILHGKWMLTGQVVHTFKDVLTALAQVE